MDFYRGKKVFITGGSSGIGRSAARLLAGWGADVMIAARGEERLNEARDEIAAAAKGGATCHALRLDITDKAAVDAAVKTVVETLGGLDILINSAGGARPGYFEELDDDVFEWMMQVNFFGLVNVVRAFVPHFREQGKGHICNVSSVLGIVGCFGYTAYAASKHAVVGFSECLRQELRPHGVDVSVVFPPDTETDGFHEENKTKPPETVAISGNAGLMQPDEVARYSLRCISKGKYHIIPSTAAKFTCFMQRHFPAVVRIVVDSDVRKAQRQPSASQ